MVCFKKKVDKGRVYDIFSEVHVSINHLSIEDSDKLISDIHDLVIVAQKKIYDVLNGHTNY